MTRYAVRLCGTGDSPLVIEGDCPDRERHTPHPRSYLDHGEWAEKMAETHVQEQCPTCGRWAIWRPMTDEERAAAERLPRDGETAAGEGGDLDGGPPPGEADGEERDGGDGLGEHEHGPHTPDMAEGGGTGGVGEGERWDPPLDPEPGSGDPVQAVRRRSNAQAVEDARRLGHIDPDRDRVVDMTYGRGGWWRIVRPAQFLAVDIDPDPDAYPTPNGNVVVLYDATDLSAIVAAGWPDVVAVDPPYKLNGTDRGEGRRYGVHGYASVSDRHSLAYRLMAEGCRILAPGGRLFYKCMAQVNGGKVRWQNYEAYGWATGMGLTLIEELGVIAGRPQPERHRWRCRICRRDNVGPSHACREIHPDSKAKAKVTGHRPWLERYPSRQEHAYMRPSVLMIFQKAG